jgi:signal transduction histidine kinase
MDTPASVTVTRNLTWRYVIALSLIAAVIIGSFILNRNQILASEKDAHIVNISGMQRMLSQRIGLMAREVYFAQSQQEADIYFKKLQAVTQKMRQNHTELSTGDLGDYGEYTLSEKIRNLYFGEYGLDKRVNNYLVLAETFVQTYSSEGVLGVRQSTLPTEIIRIARNGLLADLNQVVAQYEQEAYNKIVRFKRVEVSVLLFGLGMLLVEVFFIFKPMVRNVSQNIESLKVANDELIEFSYRISHDLRAPIVSSVGLLNVCDNAIEMDNKQMLQTALSHMKSSMAQLENLIRDVINLTKIKMGDLQYETVNLDNILQESIGKLSHLEGFEQIKITIDNSLPKDMIAPKMIVQQSLENLISNAIKYHDDSNSDCCVAIRASLKQNNYER